MNLKNHHLHISSRYLGFSVSFIIPSAHGPIFCRKELWEKSEWRPNFYRSESVHTGRLFIAYKTADLPYDFLSECHLAHMTRFFIWVFCLWQWQARSHCWITSLLFLSDKSQRTWTGFFVVSNSEKKSNRFYRSNSQRTRTDFHSEFSFHVRWAFIIFYSSLLHDFLILCCVGV